MQILDYIRTHFPECERVATYASPDWLNYWKGLGATIFFSGADWNFLYSAASSMQWNTMLSLPLKCTILVSSDFQYFSQSGVRSLVAEI